MQNRWNRAFIAVLIALAASFCASSAELGPAVALTATALVGVVAYVVLTWIVRRSAGD